MINLQGWLHSLANRAPSEPEGTPPEAVASVVPRTAWIEIGLFLSAALVFDYLFRDGTRFWAVSPHPFWAIVMLVSVQYGTSGGLLAVALSTVALLVGNVPAQGLDQDYYAYLSSIVGVPLAWGTAALVFGELRRRQLVEEATLLTELAEARRREDQLARAYGNVSQVNQRLESRVAAQLRTVFTIFHAAQAVERLKTGSVLMGAEDMVNELLSPNKFSFFVLNRNVLEAVYAHGWESGDGFQRRIGNESDIFQALVGQRRFLCVADAGDEAVLGGEGVLAGPVIHGDTEEVLGVLKIEQMGFLELHVATIENFRLICEWVGAAYARAQEYESSMFNTAPGEVRELMPTTVLEPLSKWLASLAWRAKFDLWLMTITIGEQKGIDPRPVATTVGRILLQFLRTTDLMFHSWRDAHKQYVLLPATISAGIPVVVAKIEQSVRKELPPEEGFPPVTVTVTALHLTEEEAGQPR